jgi:hypothetical protein
MKGMRIGVQTRSAMGRDSCIPLGPRSWMWNELGHAILLLAPGKPECLSRLTLGGDFPVW